MMVALQLMSAFLLDKSLVHRFFLKLTWRVSYAMAAGVSCNGACYIRVIHGDLLGLDEKVAW